VALTCLVIPALQLLLMLYLLVPLKLGRVAPQSAHLFRLLGHLQPWGMLEVFMLGILVTLVKLGHSVTLLPGISIWAFAALIVVLAAQALALDPHRVWELLEEQA
jgi:paraquat-inducible protein A